LGFAKGIKDPSNLHNLAQTKINFKYHRIFWYCRRLWRHAINATITTPPEQNANAHPSKEAVHAACLSGSCKNLQVLRVTARVRGNINVPCQGKM